MLDKQCDLARSKDRIYPQAVARAVSDLAARDAVFVFDTGRGDRVPARKTAIDFLNPDFAALARYCGGIGPDSRDGDVDHHRWLVPRRDDDVGIAPLLGTIK